jgi:hypothetical protein
LGQAEQDAFDDTHPILTADHAKGVRWHVTWQDIQWDSDNDPDVFHWDITSDGGTGITEALTVAAAAGKKIGISISMGRFCPEFLSTQLGVYKYIYDPSDTWDGGKNWGPLPWQPAYLTAVDPFIEAAATILDGNPACSYVVLGGFMELSELPIAKADVDITNLNNIAKDPATYAPGFGFSAYSDTHNGTYTAPWGTVYTGVKHVGASGFAVVRALLDGAWSVIQKFQTYFTQTPVLITGSQGPFGTQSTVQTNAFWGSWTASRLREATLAAGPSFGVTYSSLYAELPDYQTFPENGHIDPTQWDVPAYPTGRQVIYNVGHTGRSAYHGVDITYTDGVTSGTTLTSTQVTSDNGFNSNDVGRTVSGAAFAANTTITAVNSSSSVTLSQAALSNGSGKTFTVENRIPPKPSQWPQWKGIRDQNASNIYVASGRFAELWSPDIQASSGPELTQLQSDAALYESLFGSQEPPPFLAEIIISP